MPIVKYYDTTEMVRTTEPTITRREVDGNPLSRSWKIKIQPGDSVEIVSDDKGSGFRREATVIHIVTLVAPSTSVNAIANTTFIIKNGAAYADHVPTIYWWGNKPHLVKR